MLPKRWIEAAGTVFGLLTISSPPGRPEEEHLTAHEGFTVLSAVAAMTNDFEWVIWF